MPSIAAHMVVAKRVSELLNIEGKDFIFGNILPDLLDYPNTHYKVNGKVYLIPDIDKFKKVNKYPKFIYLGYLSHLLLDKYFLDEYVVNNIKYVDNLFSKEKIYRDYDYINHVLINHYKLDINYINEILTDKSYNLDRSKLNKNINCINSKIIGIPKYIDIDSFIKFLDDVSIRIANYIMEVDYED